LQAQQCKFNTDFQFSSLDPPTSTCYCQSMFPATWLTIAALLSMPAQEDSIWLTLVCFCQLDVHQLWQQSLQCSWTESETICRRTSDSRTCHMAISDSHWTRFCLVIFFWQCD